MRKFLELMHCPDSMITKLSKPTYEDIKVAIWMQQSQKIIQLIEEGAPSHHDGHSMLHYAVSEGKAQAVQLIASNYQMLIKQKNQDGYTPLMLAIFLNNSKIIKCLLQSSDLNIRDNNGNTVFMIAAANGNIPVLQQIVQTCGNTLARNFQGQTALHRAAYYGQLQTMKFLLERTSLKLCHVDRNKNNCLHMACAGCNIICINYILKKVKDPSSLKQLKNKQNKKPLELLQDTIKKINKYKKSQKDPINIDKIWDYFGQNY